MNAIAESENGYVYVVVCNNQVLRVCSFALEQQAIDALVNDTEANEKLFGAESVFTDHSVMQRINGVELHFSANKVGKSQHISHGGEMRNMLALLLSSPRSEPVDADQPPAAVPPDAPAQEPEV